MRRTQAKRITTLFLGAALGLGGCDRSAPAPPPAKGPGIKAPSATLPAGLILDQAPAGVTPVGELKQTAKEGDEVVVRVVVGGRVKPIVEGRAVTTVVDAGLANQCAQPGDACKTPWDYCCEAPKELMANLATVQILGPGGQPLAIDLSAAAKLKPGSVLVVQGTVGPRPDPATLTVNARGVFVEPAP